MTITAPPSLPPAALHLALHGAMVLLVGLLMGAPYASAIKRGAAAHTVNAWRVAHASLPMGATLMLATASVMAVIPMAETLRWLASVPMIVSAYAFCVSTSLAAMTGERGLQSGGQGWGRVVYGLNMVGVLGSLVSAVVLLCALGAGL